MKILGYKLNLRTAEPEAVVEYPNSPWVLTVHPSRIPGLHQWERTSLQKERVDAAMLGEVVDTQYYWGRTESEAKEFARIYYGYVGPIIMVWENV